MTAEDDSQVGADERVVRDGELGEGVPGGEVAEELPGGEDDGHVVDVAQKGEEEAERELGGALTACHIGHGGAEREIDRDVRHAELVDDELARASDLRLRHEQRPLPSRRRRRRLRALVERLEQHEDVDRLEQRVDVAHDGLLQLEQNRAHVQPHVLKVVDADHRAVELRTKLHDRRREQTLLQPRCKNDREVGRGELVVELDQANVELAQQHGLQRLVGAGGDAAAKRDRDVPQLQMEQLLRRAVDDRDTELSQLYVESERQLRRRRRSEGALRLHEQVGLLLAHAVAHQVGRVRARLSQLLPRLLLPRLGMVAQHRVAEQQQPLALLDRVAARLPQPDRRHVGRRRQQIGLVVLDAEQPHRAGHVAQRHPDVRLGQRPWQERAPERE
eukprot:1709040-Pleurochrysis_carterae.AAC.1